jgi:hypothetical protein
MAGSRYVHPAIAEIATELLCKFLGVHDGSSGCLGHASPCAETVFVLAVGQRAVAVRLSCGCLFGGRRQPLVFGGGAAAPARHPLVEISLQVADRARREAHKLRSVPAQTLLREGRHGETDIASRPRRPENDVFICSQLHASFAMIKFQPSTRCQSFLEIAREPFHKESTRARLSPRRSRLITSPS